MTEPNEYPDEDAEFLGMKRYVIPYADGFVGGAWGDLID